MNLYVFLMSRPCDKGDVWPVVYQSRELAEKSEHRVSEIAEVSFETSEAIVGAEHG